MKDTSHVLDRCINKVVYLGMLILNNAHVRRV
jgi:hypothetical protein